MLFELTTNFINSLIDDWIKHGNSSYFYEMKFMTWQDARDFCSKKNAHLVDIDNIEENEFLLELVEHKTGQFWIVPFWISLNDIEREGTFVASDGSKPKFFNWISDGPDAGADVSDCTHVAVYESGSKNWDDEPCNDQKPFVCEKSHGE